MTRRRNVWLLFGAIVILAVLAGVVDYPKGPDIRLGSFSRQVKVQLGLDLQGGSHLVYEADMANIPEGDRGESLDGIRDIIERRVNAFGVSEPLVQTNRTGNAYRLIVELPGVTDVAEAIRQIGETPLLEFREQTSETDVTISDEQKAALASFNESQKKKADAVLQKALAPDADFAKLADEFSDDPGNTAEDGTKKGGDLEFAKRGTYVAAFEKVAFDELKVGEMTKTLVETPFGYHLIKKEEERTVQEEGKEVPEVRVRHILIATQSEEQLRQQLAQGYTPTGLSGKQLKRAQVQFDPTTNEPTVALQFDDEGTKLFAEITKRNLQKPVAIYLDGSPISIPTVQSEITDGQAVITGSFTLTEAKQLAQRLNSGALPVPVTLVSQQTIGASLGKDAVERSLIAGLIGFAFVALFMVVYYRLPGLIAVVALSLYTLLLLAIFKLWPVTLTLAGIAGFILSVGIAVDANILIFERVREELRQGKPLVSAIDEGFRRAWLSIRDSNVSSLITTFILSWFGTSLIKGFALTLAIGILVSMFSAITVTRTLLRIFLTPRMEHHLRWFIPSPEEPRHV